MLYDLVVILFITELAETDTETGQGSNSTGVACSRTVSAEFLKNSWFSPHHKSLFKRPIVVNTVLIQDYILYSSYSELDVLGLNV